VIPTLRGDLRSRPLPSLLREAKGLVDRGVRELILIAQDLGNYGKDLEPPVPLSKLLEGLCRIDGLEWIRLLYLHPAHVPKELAGIMAEEPKICPYLDLPLQHIDDRILRAMNRGVSSAEIRHLIEELRSGIPHLRLRTTVMVGFPGESEKNFSSLLEFIRKAEFDHLGAFAYSREEGTPAARMKGHLPQAVKERRLREVMEAQAEISRKKNETLIGTRQRVLIDQVIPAPEPSPKPSPEPSRKPSWRGRMSGQAPEIDGVVYVRGKAGAPGEFMEVEIIEADTYDLVGRRLV
jgi:ribosomal protein S12 methylthiotransferase